MRKKTVSELHRINISQFREMEKIPLIVILDDVRSLNNVGSVFRTADALALSHIYLCGITATPPHPDIHKTALGAEDSVGWSYESDVVQLIVRLREEGVVVCSLEQVEGSISLPDFKVEKGKRYAIVAGNEVKGVSQAAVDASDCSVEIPQHGTKHSLNVSISTAIALWHFSQQM